MTSWRDIIDNAAKPDVCAKSQLWENALLFNVLQCDAIGRRSTFCVVIWDRDEGASHLSLSANGTRATRQRIPDSGMREHRKHIYITNTLEFLLILSSFKQTSIWNPPRSKPLVSSQNVIAVPVSQISSNEHQTNTSAKRYMYIHEIANPGMAPIDRIN